jgi:hypothetical protein
MAQKMTVVIWLVLSFWSDFTFPASANATNDKSCERPESLSGCSLSSTERLLNEYYQSQQRHPKMVDEEVVDTSYPIASFRSKLTRQLPGTPEFAVISDRFERTDPEEIVLPSDALMCLIAPPALLLLSDGTANHYVTVANVDKSGETVSILDGWPEQSFLIGTDLRTSDRGKLLKLPNGGVLIEVPTRTVLSFLVGAIFPEKANGFTERLGKVTDLNSDAKNLLAIGLSLYADATPDTCDPALDFISRASALAKRDGLPTLERSANRELAFTLIMCVLTNSQQIQSQMKQSYLDRFEQIDGDALFRDSDARAEELIRLSQAFKESNQSNMAYFFANLAVQRDASLDDAFAQRANVLIGLGNYDKAMPDALEAYRLNTLRIRNVLKSPTDDFLNFFYTNFAGGGGINKLEDITLERKWILYQLVDIYSSKKMYPELLALSNEADRFMSVSSFGASIHAEAELGLGHDDLARQALQEALRRAAADPAEADFVKRRLRSIFGERADKILN